MAVSNRQFRDIDMNFTAHPVTGDVSKKVGDDAIIQSMKNLLNTNKYERLMQPNIYGNLRKYLFEPVDAITGSAIGRAIDHVISRFEPRVNLTEVKVEPNYAGDGYDVSITFFIVNQTNPITVELFLERIR